MIKISDARRGALTMRALREVKGQLPGEQYDRQFDLAQGATALVLAAAAKQATGAPDPSAYGIDAEALAKEFAKKYGLPIERATHVVQVLVNECATEGFAQDAAEYLKQRTKGVQENMTEVGDGEGGDSPQNSATASRGLDSLSVVQTMRRLTGDPTWGPQLGGASSAAQPAAQAPAQAPPKVLDLRGFAGRNVTERAMNAVREQSHGRRWSFDELHEAGCELIRLARASGAEVLS